MTKLKSAAAAVVKALSAPALHPAEAAILRAVAVAVMTALGIKLA